MAALSIVRAARPHRTAPRRSRGAPHAPQPIPGPLLVAASLLATAPAHGQPAPAAVLASDEAQRIALDAYVYFYPWS